MRCAASIQARKRGNIVRRSAANSSAPSIAAVRHRLKYPTAWSRCATNSGERRSAVASGTRVLSGSACTTPRAHNSTSAGCTSSGLAQR